MFSACRRSEGETFSSEGPIKKGTSKGWYIAAITVGSLIVISAVVFAVLSHFQTSLPAWLARAVGTVANTPYGLGLWGVRLGGILIGGGLIAFGTIKIHQMQKSEPPKVLVPPQIIPPQEQTPPLPRPEETISATLNEMLKEKEATDRAEREADQQLYENSFFRTAPDDINGDFLASLNRLVKGRYYSLKRANGDEYLIVLRANVNLYFSKWLSHEEYLKLEKVVGKQKLLPDYSLSLVPAKK